MILLCMIDPPASVSSDLPFVAQRTDEIAAVIYRLGIAPTRSPALSLNGTG